MNIKLPLVTVITAVYNRADLVDETIKSVLSQDYPNIEYIVLDDGSTDDSWQVLQKYRRRVVLASTKIWENPVPSTKVFPWPKARSSAF